MIGQFSGLYFTAWPAKFKGLFEFKSLSSLSSVWTHRYVYSVRIEVYGSRTSNSGSKRYRFGLATTRFNSLIPSVRSDENFRNRKQYKGRSIALNIIRFLVSIDNFKPLSLESMSIASVATDRLWYWNWNRDRKTSIVSAGIDLLLILPLNRQPFLALTIEFYH